MTQLNVALLTVSDTRDFSTDKSGDYLAEQVEGDGHHLHSREIVIDDTYKIRAVLSTWVADDSVQVVVITGGTGFYGRDSTPEAVEPLLDKLMPGFGELFRSVSYQEIGSSTIQSRALAGMANKTVVFCLPGSTGACKTAWSNIISDQLKADFKPCNFVKLLQTGIH